MDPIREMLLRSYASGKTNWSTLRNCGFESFVDVLAGLDELGLRYPIASLDGPNEEMRRRGRQLLREALDEAMRIKQPKTELD